MGFRALLSAVYCLDSHALDSSVAKRFQSSEMVAPSLLTASQALWKQSV